METRFTKLLGLTAPIQLAAMPGVVTPELVTAVSSAGALGMLPAPMLSPSALESTLDGIRSSCSAPFGVNFLMPFLDRDCVAVAASRSNLVEFFYGPPDPELVEEVHSHGALAGWQVGSLAEALEAERAGCDLVVAQGTEAGGHVRGKVGLLPLLSQVVAEVRIPVLAAGGIATAGDVAAVLACGAEGARVGTRFVCSTESGAHPSYVQALLEASAEDTCLTEAFSEMWPDAPHRVLRSSIQAAQAATEAVVGETRIGERSLPVPRLSVICPSAATTGRIDAMALYAGESVANVHRVQPAAEIVADLVSVPQRPRPR